MQRMLTAAAIVAGFALSTTGLALAQSSTMPQSGTPSTVSPQGTTTANPGTTNPGMMPSNGTTNPSGTAGASSLNNPANGMSSADNQAAMNPQSPGAIREVQQQLQAQGLYRGAIDGQMGPETRAALSRFQRRNGLPQTAELDQNTMSRLLGNRGTGTTNMPAGASGSSLPPSTMNPSRTPAGPGTNSSSSYGAPGAGSSGAMGTPTQSGTGTTAH